MPYIREDKITVGNLAHARKAVLLPVRNVCSQLILHKWIYAD